MDETTFNSASGDSAPPGPPPALPVLPSASGDPRPPAPPRGPALGRWSTWLWSLALLVGGSLLLVSIAGNRDQLLEDPDAYLERVVGRDLDAAEYAQHMPPWQKFLSAWQSSDLPQALQDAAQAYRQFRRHGALEHPGPASRTLAILLVEQGKVDEAKQELPTTGGDEANPAFNAAFAQAYLAGAITNRLESGQILPRISPAWARDKLELHLASKAGDQVRADQIRSRLLARGRVVQDRATILSAVSALLVLVGVCCLLRWVWKGCADLHVAEGLSSSPWTLWQGYAVLVRAAVMGMIIAGCLAMLNEKADLVSALDHWFARWPPLARSVAGNSLAILKERLEGLTGLTTLLAGLPLWWLGHRYLLHPNHGTLCSSFGLIVPRRNLGQLPWLCLAVMSLMLLGEAAISWLPSPQTSFVESIPEEFIFHPWPEVLLSSVDAIVWAPLVEEIAFRGMLYTTLRRRLPSLLAAGASACIFALVHGYSLQGFLVIFWSGFLWAVAYEKSRSLWPGMLCHALSNTLAVATPVLVYRL